MTWEERQQEAAYTSPTGLRTVFQYENVSTEINKRDSVIEFPDYAGALVQNRGIGASAFPMLIFFSGPDHDLEADDFLNRLAEEGQGILEHPLYGRFENIVPTGPIKRRDDLKTAANQTVFQVNFIQSAPFLFPGSVFEISDQIEENLNLFRSSQGAQFAEDIKIENARENISLKDSLKSKLNQVKQSLKQIVRTVDEVKREFDNIFNSIIDNLDALIGTPLQLALQVIDLVKTPARAAGQISRILEGYRTLADGILAEAEGLFEASLGNISLNSFAVAELFSNAAFGGMLIASQSSAEKTREQTGFSLTDFFAVSPEETLFITRRDIIDNIEFLTEYFDLINNWNEENRLSLNIPDTGNTYTYLNKALAAVSGFLIQTSFTARQEIIFRVQSPRNFIELCIELYGVTDNAFDFFILTNKLTSDEIVEIPRGRVIRYYA